MLKKSSKGGKSEGSKKVSFLERLVIKITIPCQINREVIKREVSYGTRRQVCYTYG